MTNGMRKRSGKAKTSSDDPPSGEQGGKPMTEISIPGQKDTAAVGEQPATALGVGVTVKDAVRVGAVRGSETPVTVSAADDDVVEFRMDGGAVIWMRGDEVSDRLGTGAARGADEVGVVRIDPSLPIDDRTRGIGSWAIEALQVLGIDLAGHTARQIAEAFEEKVVPRPGLYRWDGSDDALGDAFVETEAGGKPWLVFIHGTASSTLGGFSDLPKLQAGIWQQLRSTYGERILAFDHRTLTESPIANALALVRALPAEAELHLVSHSRGGLVGELVGRGRLTDLEGQPRAAFDELELGLFDDAAYQAQHAELVELNEALARKRLRVTRFVRVASPSRGTSLMGGKIDRWLNLVFNVAGFALGGRLNPVTSELLDALRALVQATVKERTDPATLPGLAAMSPEYSPLLQVLNRREVRQDDGLQIIAGDVEPTNLLRRLAIWFADQYFGDNHDLVVDTGSMDGGAPRTTPPTIFRDKGATVTHFNYFANTSSAGALGGVLAGKPGARGIGEELVRAAEQPMPELRTRGTGQLPVVFVLPGISGSHLKIGDDRIWINVFRLATGGVARLDIGNSRVEPDGPIALYYGDLCRFLDETHEVRPWAYDWRRSILDTARRFAVDLHAAFDSTSRPVRIVAHSMGGLVARAALASDEALWKRFVDRAGSRLVMLGTPNGGSLSIPLMLLGRNQLMQYLAALDFKASAEDQLKVVACWPGTLQMLPEGGKDSAGTGRFDLFEPDGWTALAKADPGARWPTPSTDGLLEARRFRQLLNKAKIDPERMFYIAGQADTYQELKIDAKKPHGERVRFTVTTEGDGQVLWATGIPKGIRRWFTDAVHGDLARHKPAFRAILDLIDHGSTDALQTSPAAVTRARGAPETISREATMLIPSEDQLLASAVGGSVRAASATAVPGVTVTVVHGHLAFASHPVLVGHYLGDLLNGAERVLDQRYDNRVDKRRRLGLHPGPIESFDVHLDSTRKPPGSVIVGLGAISDLSSGDLHRTIRRGLLALGAAMDERDAKLSSNAGAQADLKPRGISCVLVGTGEGVIAVSDCVMAIMRAVKEANSRLGSGGFERLEVIELVEQQANNAWHAFRQRVEHAEFKGRFVLPGPVERTKGAERRIGPEADPSWWTPVTITRERNAGDDPTAPRPDRGTLKYVAIAGRARAEASLVGTRRSFVDRYVARMTAHRVEEGAMSAARTLFELLWPNPLKEQSLDDRNIRLILDESSASLPWEMMDDRRPWKAAGEGAGEETRGPPAVRSGVLRQLISERFREGVVSLGSRRKALVIGDPRGDGSNLVELPGAQREAEAVRRVLETRGYNVTPLIGSRAKPEDVVSALFAEAWEIVHVAAHGVVDYAFPDDAVPNSGGSKNEKRTGIVLGKNMVLDADLLEQMPEPPELFFVNCCLLGHVDESAEADHLRRNRPALASSVAVQLIKMGVRAVVAAGWEVDDDAAATFAEKFYSGLLAGGELGTVARDARAEVYGSYPSSSTWGAYQVYGQPDFRLPSVESRSRHSAEPPVYASPTEAAAAIERIEVGSEVGGARDRDQNLQALYRAEEAVAARGWLGRAEIRSSLASAFAQLKDFDKAVEHYSAAALTEEANVPVKAIEQRLNLIARQAADSPKDDDQESEQKVLESIHASTTALKQLIWACGETLERFSLVGSTYKRRAQRTTGDARTKNLKEMEKYYRKARKLGQQRGVSEVYYPWSQELAAKVMIGLRTKESINFKLDDLRRSLPPADSSKFWLQILPADLQLLEAVANGKLTAEEQDAIVKGYIDIWNHVGTDRELSSVRDQLKFLINILEDPELDQIQSRTALLKDMKAISQRLEQIGQN